MTDKRVGVRIEVGVDGQPAVQDLTQRLDGLEQGAKQVGEAGKAAATGTRQFGQAAETAAADVAQADKATTGLGNAAGKAAPQLDQARRSLDGVKTEASQSHQAIAQLRDQLIAGFAVKELISAAAEMEQIASGLKAVAGDSKVAGDQMEFVRRMAQAAGVDVTAAGKAFLGLAAATKGTAVEGEPARQVFEAVTLAMAKAGKGSAETQNALLALSQIASKGTVQMEELRGQLGEALPGALQAAAKGLGITTQDLIKLVESGQLAAEDLFPALAKGLNDLYGGAPAAQTLSQEITNIKNAFVEMAANIGDEGGLAALKVGAEGAQAAIAFLGDSLIQTGQYIGTLAAAVVSLDFSQLSAAFAKIEEDSRTRLLKAAEHNTVLQSALKASGIEAKNAANAAEENFRALERSGQAAEATGTSVAKLGVQYAKARTELEQQLAVATKEVDAVKARGQAAVAQASALNDEALKRKAVGQAAADEADALDKVAKLRSSEYDLLVKERAEKEAAIKAAGPISEQRKKELEDLDNLILKKGVERDTSLAQAAAAREHARATSERVQAAQAEQDKTQALVVTRTAAAKAALSDLQVQRDLAVQAGELARLMGDEEGVRKFKIAQIEIEIKLIKARAEVSKVEAEGTIAVAKAKLAELEASGQLTPLKRAEIQASIDLAEAKLREAKALGSSTQVLEAQINALRNGTGALDGFAGSSRGAASSQGDLAGSVGATNKVLLDTVSLLSGATDAQRRYAAALNGTYYAQLQLDKSGPGAHNANGTGGLAGIGDNSTTAGNNGVYSVFSPSSGRYDSQGFAVGANGQRFTAGSQLTIPDGFYFDSAAANRSPAFLAGRTDGREFIFAKPETVAAQQKAMDAELASRGGAQFNNGAGTSLFGSTGSATTGTATPTEVATTRTLRLELGGGRSLDYQATSDAEAARVETLLRTLASEAARAA